jgi:hypothetical protein
VSPSPSSCSETLRTLRFGERCQSVCLGAVKRAQGTSARSSKQAEAAAKAADAAEERAAKLQAELIDSRRANKEARTPQIRRAQHATRAPRLLASRHMRTASRIDHSSALVSTDHNLPTRLTRPNAEMTPSMHRACATPL